MCDQFLHDPAINRIANVQPCTLDGDARIVQHLFEHVVNQGDNVRVVLLGTSTLGTEQFLRVRAQLTKRLMQENSFSMLALEADYPDTYEINQFVQCLNGYSSRHSATCASQTQHPLSHFQRFPRWVWNNDIMFEFVNWLRDFNKTKEPDKKVGCYGLDLYSLQSSIDVITDYLTKNHSNCSLADTVNQCYAEFNRFAFMEQNDTTLGDSKHEKSMIDTDKYSYKVGLGLSESCQHQVLEALRAMLSHHHRANGNDHFYFHCMQNAKLIKNAECYYRSMFLNTETCTPSWNIRDRHMFDTLIDLIKYQEERTGVRQKVIIWAHNSHVGDDSHTEMSNSGQINLGQRVKEHFGTENTFSVGCLTYEGTVNAALNWREKKDQEVALKEAVEGSYECMFHEMLTARNYTDHQFSLIFNQSQSEFDWNRLPVSKERNIGAVYNVQQQEQWKSDVKQYISSKISKRYDSIVHVDRTSAIGPFRVPPFTSNVVDFSPCAFPGLAHPELTLSKKDMMEDGFFDLKAYKSEEDRKCLSEHSLQCSNHNSEA